MPEAVPVHVLAQQELLQGTRVLSAQCYRETTASGIPTSLGESDRVQRRLGDRT